MEEQMFKLEFAYTDEFNQESKLTKRLSHVILDDISSLDLIVEEFKLFLISSGFSKEQVFKLKFEE